MEDEVVLADTLGPALLLVLDALTPSERLAFVFHVVFAVPFDDIAAIVGRSAAAARQLASRARRGAASRSSRRGGGDRQPGSWRTAHSPIDPSRNLETKEQQEMDPPRSIEDRKRNAFARLSADKDARTATADAAGNAYLLPLSFLWDRTG